ncbi:hypothetical protein ACE0DR_01185 [Azotobacter sp. CWF10]
MRKHPFCIFGLAFSHGRGRFLSTYCQPTRQIASVAAVSFSESDMPSLDTFNGNAFSVVSADQRHQHQPGGPASASAVWHRAAKPRHGTDNDATRALVKIVETECKAEDAIADSGTISGWLAMCGRGFRNVFAGHKSTIDASDRFLNDQFLCSDMRPRGVEFDFAGKLPVFGTGYLRLEAPTKLLADGQVTETGISRFVRCSW